MYQFIFYVPQSHVEKVKNAVFSAGAGNIGNYSHCCWQTLGSGQFKPLAKSSPYIGKENTLTHIDEYKVEMVCADSCIDGVVKALKASHPYETPAYHVIKLVNS